MKIFQKTIATLLTICMMFTVLPQSVYENLSLNVFADGNVVGTSGYINSNGKVGKDGGYMGEMPYYVISLMDTPKNYNDLTTRSEEAIVAEYRDEWIKIDDYATQSLFFVPYNGTYNGIDASVYPLNEGLAYAHKGEEGNPLQYIGVGRYEAKQIYNDLDMSYNNVPIVKSNSKKDNVFYNEVMKAYNEKKIRSIADLSNGKWRDYIDMTPIATEVGNMTTRMNSKGYKDSVEVMGYLLGDDNNVDKRIEDFMNPDTIDTRDIKLLNARNKLGLAVGYVSLLVNLYNIAEGRGLSGMAGKYEAAINNYCSNSNNQEAPVTLGIEKAYLMQQKNSDDSQSVFSLKVFDYMRAYLLTDASYDIIDETFIKTEFPGSAGSTKDMMTAMLTRSVEHLPLSMTAATNSGYPRRIADNAYKHVGNGGLKYAGALGWVQNAYQFTPRQKHEVAAGNVINFRTHTGADGILNTITIKEGTDLYGFMIVGNYIATPPPTVSFSVDNIVQCTQDVCSEDVRPTTPAKIRLTINGGANTSGLIEILNSRLENNEVEIPIEVDIKRTVYRDSIGNVFEGRENEDCPELEAGVALELSGQNAINVLSGQTIELQDTEILNDVYTRDRNSATTMIYEYNVDVNITIDGAKYEYKSDDIVLKNGETPMKYASFQFKAYAQPGARPEPVPQVDVTAEKWPSDVEGDIEKWRNGPEHWETTAMVKSYEYSTEGSAYAEIKSNYPLQEKYEVLGGIPSTEELYFSVGGSEFKVAMVLQYWMNQHSRDRTYHIHFEGNTCEYNNQEKGKGDSWEGIDLPKASSSRAKQTETRFEHASTSDPEKSTVYPEGLTNNKKYGPLTVTITWEGKIKNNAKEVSDTKTASGHSSVTIYAECVAEPDHTDYLADVADANAFMTAMAGKDWSWTAASDKVERKLTVTDMNIGTGDSNLDPSGSGSGSKDFSFDLNGNTGLITGSISYEFTNPATTLGNNNTSFSCNCGGHGKYGTGDSPVTQTTVAKPDTDKPYKITLTYTIKPHAICGPCCGHVMPDIWDMWKQGLIFDYAKISQIRLFKLDQGSVDGLDELTGIDGRVFANVVSGNPTYFMNIAQQTASNYDKATGTENMPVKYTDPDTETYKEFGRVNYLPMNKNELAKDNHNQLTYYSSDTRLSQSSRAGRLRYTLAPGQTDATITITEQGNGTGGSYKVIRDRMVATWQHDDVFYELSKIPEASTNGGRRSMNCDGMASTNNFGKLHINNSNPTDDEKTGHENDWADGILYTNILGFSIHNANSPDKNLYSTDPTKDGTKDAAGVSEVFINYWKTDSFGNSFSPLEMMDNDKRALSREVKANPDGPGAIAGTYFEDYDHHGTLHGFDMLAQFNIEKKDGYYCRSDEIDRNTAEWKFIDEARKTKVVANVISDFLILQTSGGDQAIFYYEKATEPTELQAHFKKLDITEEEMFDQNPLSVFQKNSEICVETDNGALKDANLTDLVIVGGYNGQYNNPTKKYKPYSSVTNQFYDFPKDKQFTYDATTKTGTYNVYGGSTIRTIFDSTSTYGDPAKTISRPKRQATSQETSFKVLQDNIRILPTAPNKLYTPTDARVWYSQVEGFYSTDMGYRNAERDVMHVDTIGNVSIGYPQKNRFGEDYKVNWGNEIGVEDGTKYYATPDGNGNSKTVNNIVVYTPVSTEDAMILEQGNLEINGLSISRDQRVDNSLPNMNDMVNKLKVCPLDPAECEYRVLNCKYHEPQVLAQFNFEDTYEATEQQLIDGAFKNVTVTKQNTYTNGDGTLVTTNILNGIEYQLPTGFSKSNGKLVANGGAGTRWTIPFADIGLSNSANNTIQIDMDLTVSSGSLDNMIVGLHNVGLLITNTNSAETSLTSRSLLDNTKQGVTLDSTFDGVSNVTNAKVSLKLAFNNIKDSKVTINGKEATVEVFSEYKKTWTTQVDENGNEFRTQITEVIELDDLVAEPPSGYKTTDIGSNINIGCWGQDNAYGAHFTIDNLKITLLGGSDTHTSACYETVITHSTKKVHVCDENCYTKEDMYMCNGVLNSNYQLGCGKEENEIAVTNENSRTYNYTGSPQYVTLAKGKYILETWGAQGASYSTYQEGGKGGYSYGILTLDKTTTIHITVGGTNGYNGGGNKGQTYSSGGGATHMALSKAAGGNPAPDICYGSFQASTPYCWYQTNTGCSYEYRYAYSDNATSFSYHCGGWVRKPEYDYNVAGMLSGLKNKTSDVLIVAGGGGGAQNYSTNSYSKNAKPGVGGGTSGKGNVKYTGSSTTYYAYSGGGGTQSAGGAAGNSYSSTSHKGTAGVFGQGGNGYNSSYGGGGGGGYYGGGGGAFNNSGTAFAAGGGGGSGYVKDTLSNEYTKAGDETFNGVVVGTTETGHSGNGAAKITVIEGSGGGLEGFAVDNDDLIGHIHEGHAGMDYSNGCYTVPTEHKHIVTEKVLICNKLYDSVVSNGTTWTFGTGGNTYNSATGETYIDLEAGTYKLEVWGAQGGSGYSSSAGGKGGYSVGEYTLTSDDRLYINIGGQGVPTSGSGFTQTPVGGYNGGGNGNGDSGAWGGAGGGATHIGLKSGLLTSFSGDYSTNLLIVAGGGGGGGHGTAGGAGGGTSGIAGTSGAAVGTQTSGNAFGQGGSSTGHDMGAGGGGFYGAKASTTQDASAGGGSGYVNLNKLNSGSTHAGNTSFRNTADTADETGHVGNGFAKITALSVQKPHTHTDACYIMAGRKICGLEVGENDGIVYTFGTGGNTFNQASGSTSMTLPAGEYTLEVWGAQGGNGYTSSSYIGQGGKGGYSKGDIVLSEDTLIYVNVGGQGSTWSNNTNVINGGTNGGGQGYQGGGGGGASDIRINSNSTYSRVIVAGGGGGGQHYSTNTGVKGFGGVGGGTSGGNGGYSAYWGQSSYIGKGGSQTAGGINPNNNSSAYNGSFGAGGTYYYSYTGGGGSGWYGGSSGGHNGTGGGGGSGYVLTSTSSKPTGYLLGSEYYLENVEIKAGNSTFSNTAGTGTETGHSGNGFVKITSKGHKHTTSCYETVYGGVGGGYTCGIPTGGTEEVVGEFSYKGSEEHIDLPAGRYKLEVWGAQGGNSCANGTTRTTGGKGGYSVGEFTLSSSDTLYINVGGKGLGPSNTTGYDGGYNGGGSVPIDSNSDRDDGGGSGGGATHIGLKSGLLSTFSSDYTTNLLIVAGGGGGGGFYSAYNSTVAGYGGGESAGSGEESTSKATQSLGYSFGLGQSGDNGNNSTVAGGGGGGFYGGYKGVNNSYGGGGGSGYVNTAKLTSATTTAGNVSFTSPTGTSETGHSGNGYARITRLSHTHTSECGGSGYICGKTESTLGTPIEFAYTGSVQPYTLPEGKYKLEVWGAEGGTGSGTVGGKGGYSVGELTLTTSTNIYVYAGGAGKRADVDRNGGFNGGGSFKNSTDSVATGGGGTDIRLNSDSLYSRVIVAGGGGGGTYSGGNGSVGGYGGGTTGGTATNGGGGGTQTSGGTSYDYNTAEFGKGAYNDSGSNSGGGMGGGGWYGGGSGNHGNGSANSGGGGGSGYVYTSSTASNYPQGCTLNSNYYLTNASTTAGNQSFTSPTGSNETGHSGNGYARITPLEGHKHSASCMGGGVQDFEYTGEVETVTLGPGTHILETWGAEGGGSRLSGNASSGLGGLGGYSIGTLNLSETTTVYIRVGGAGASSTSGKANGGFNGGGAGYASSSGEPGNGGGGASDIRIGQDNLYTRVIVAGGGGGGGEDVGDAYGHGGGLSGVNGTSTSTYNATQTSAGTNGSFGQGANTNIGDGGGGGGGWYGGGSTQTSSSGGDTQGGGGGSGYVYTADTASNYPSGCLLDAKYYLTDAETIAGDQTFLSPEGTDETGHSGNGHIRITSQVNDWDCKFIPAGTFMCTGELNTVTDFNTHEHTEECLLDEHQVPPATFTYTETVQTYVIPYTDYYTLEAYGPHVLGQGGYAKATYRFKQGTRLYIYVGSDIYNDQETDVRIVSKPGNQGVAGEEGTYQTIIQNSNNSRLVRATSRDGFANTFSSYEPIGVETGTRGTAISGMVTITCNNSPLAPTLDDIVNGNLTDEEVIKHIGPELYDMITNSASVFKTYSEFSIDDTKGVVSNNNTGVFFVDDNIVLHSKDGNTASKFYIRTDLEAQTLRRVRITLVNNTSSTEFKIAANNTPNTVSATMQANSTNEQVITFNVADAWKDEDISILYFLPQTKGGGVIKISKIELIGHATFVKDSSGYTNSNLLTLSNFSADDTKGFTNISNTSISYSGNKMVVTSKGSNPQTQWTTLNSMNTSAIKAIKLVFTNKSSSITQGRLYYKTSSASWAADNAFMWYVGGSSAGTQTVWIDTASHTAYNETMNMITTEGSGWSGTINNMRFDWSELTSGNIEVSSITFYGNGTTTGTGSYQYQETVLANKDTTWTFGSGGNTLNANSGSSSIYLGKGTYKLEVWGAQGGSYSSLNNGGYGGYSSAEYTLTDEDTLYIVVGGQGSSSTGGYNGGGSGKLGGGGATHIGLKSGLLTSFSSDYSSNLLIVAGGGGGAGNDSGSGQSAAGAGGKGGGANQAGTNGIANCGSIGYGGTLSGGGAGGTRSSGSYSAGSGSFGQGGNGYTASYTTNGSGGGGGGFYGGGGSIGDLPNYNDYDDSGAGGGSGYANTGKLNSGTISGTVGERAGNGFAKITALTQSIESTLTSSPVTITSSSTSKVYYTATYNNPLTRDNVKQTIIDNYLLIPDYVDGDYNPLWLCRFDKLNVHLCVTKDGEQICKITEILKCNEPHHKKVTVYDENGQKIGETTEHYPGTNDICWDACGNDENHKLTKTQTELGDGETVRLAEFLQLDEGFTVYFPNRGDFYGNGALGLSSPQVTRGYGYKNNMDTTNWTREKRVRFPFDVIYEGELYNPKHWIELDVEQEVFNFYLPVSNPEMSNVTVEFEVEAINCGTTDGVSVVAGISYNNKVNETYATALETFINGYMDNWIADIKDVGGYKIPFTTSRKESKATDVKEPDLLDFEEIGYLQFYLNKMADEEKLSDAVNTINIQVQKDFEGNNTNSNIINPHTVKGNLGSINNKMKNRSVNDNKTRVSNLQRRSSLQSLHGGYKFFYMDVIGRIGNFTITDTEDYKFSNFFKWPTMVTGDMTDTKNWLVDGLVMNVDEGIQNYYIGDTYDIRGYEAQGNTLAGNDYGNLWLDTYGTQSWMRGQFLGEDGEDKDNYPNISEVTLDDGTKIVRDVYDTSSEVESDQRDVTKPNLYSQILAGDVNNIEVLKDEEMQFGYDIFTSIVTFGNYQNGRVQVVPKYYALKLTNENVPNVTFQAQRNEYIPLDVYISRGGTYTAVNIFGNAGNGQKNIGGYTLDDYSFNLDWTVESHRRNYSLEEKARTNRICDSMKQYIYNIDNIDDIAGDGQFIAENFELLRVEEAERPKGMNNYLGTSQYMLMTGNHRTFIGSSNTYGNNIWVGPGETTQFGVKEDNGKFTASKLVEPAEGSYRLKEDDFERAVQRWHGKLGVPSSSVFVPHGEPVNAETIKYVMNDSYAIICTAEIIVMGSTWNLAYSQPWFNNLTIGDEEFKTHQPGVGGDHFPGHRDEDGIPCDFCPPPIIAVYSSEASSVDDIEIVGSH